MITHIASEHDYVYAFYNALEKHFNLKDHTWLIIRSNAWSGNANEDLIKDKIKWAIGENDQDIKDILDKSSLIIIHSLFSQNLVNFLYKNSKYLEKSALMTWGGDIYQYRNGKNDFKREMPGNIIKKLRYLSKNLVISLKVGKRPFTRSHYELKRSKIFKQISCIACSARDDYELIKEQYNTRAEYINAFYPSVIDYDLLNNFKNDNYRQRESYNFLIGNSASETNQHVEIFNRLSKFRNKNIKIYCPLSYGNDNYRKLVIDEGKKVFGKKFIPITRLISPENYLKFLNEMDVIFMNHNRQQALGNIKALLCLGKKIYIKYNVTSYNYLSALGLKVFNIDNIDEFESIICMNKEILEKNKQIANKEFSYENWYNCMNNLLSLCQSG